MLMLHGWVLWRREDDFVGLDFTWRWTELLWAGLDAPAGKQDVWYSQAFVGLITFFSPSLFTLTLVLLLVCVLLHSHRNRR